MAFIRVFCVELMQSTRVTRVVDNISFVEMVRKITKVEQIVKVKVYLYSKTDNHICKMSLFILAVIMMVVSCPGSLSKSEFFPLGTV